MRLPFRTPDPTHPLWPWLIDCLLLGGFATASVGCASAVVVREWSAVVLFAVIALLGAAEFLVRRPVVCEECDGRGWIEADDDPDPEE